MTRLANEIPILLSFVLAVSSAPASEPPAVTDVVRTPDDAPSPRRGVLGWRCYDHGDSGPQHVASNNGIAFSRELGSTWDTTHITWSIMPLGTDLGVLGSNNLQTTLNADFGDDSWRDVIQGVFDSISLRTGLTFEKVTDSGRPAYNGCNEPNDDNPFGEGMIRIGMGDLSACDRPGEGTPLAFAYEPAGGGDIFFHDESTWDVEFNGVIKLHNTLSHEVGHALGLAHTCPEDGTKLMEPSINYVDGMQADERAGLQAMYGTGDGWEAGHIDNRPEDAFVIVPEAQLFGPHVAEIQFPSVHHASDRDLYRLDLLDGDVARIFVEPPPLFLEGAQPEASELGSCEDASVDTSVLGILANLRIDTYARFEFDLTGMNPVYTGFIDDHSALYDSRGDEYHEIVAEQNGPYFFGVSAGFPFFGNMPYNIRVEVVRPDRRVIYVNPNSKPDEFLFGVETGRTGTSWAESVSLFEALNIAAADPTVEELWLRGGLHITASAPIGVSPGPLIDGFVIPRGNLALYGGFEGNETVRSQRDPDANETVLDGMAGGEYPIPGHALHVIGISGTGDDLVVLDGLTIRGGRADRRNQISSVGGYPDESGGGVVIHDSRTDIVDCDIIQNGAFFSGGGLYATAARELRVHNCRFLGNWADDEDSAAGEHAAWQLQTPGWVANCLVSGNRCSGFLADIASGPTQIVSCSFVGNESYQELFPTDPELTWVISGATVTNCLVIDNLAATVFRGGLPVGSSNNFLQGVSQGDPLLRLPAGLDGVYGTIDDDPTPLPGSPLIDAGSTDPAVLAIMASTDDIYGYNRCVDIAGVGTSGPGCTPDIGAVEYQGPPPTAFELTDPENGQDDVPLALELTWTPAGGGLPVSHRVRIDPDPVVVADPRSLAEIDVPAPGPYTLSNDRMTVPAALLEQGTTYHWAVFAESVGGQTQSLEGVRSFTTMIDCDGNGVHDPDELMTDPGSVDCNSNGLLDACELAQAASTLDSGMLACATLGCVPEYTFTAVEAATSNVAVRLEMRGDLRMGSADLIVGGATVATLGPDATGCGPQTDSVETTLNAGVFNTTALNQDGTLVVGLALHASFDPSACGNLPLPEGMVPGTSWRTTLSYATSSSVDGDLNGVIDACEAPICPCDIDGNLSVDVADLLAFLATWFHQSGLPTPAGPGSGADYNADDAVDINDLLGLLSCWFSTNASDDCS